MPFTIDDFLPPKQKQIDTDQAGYSVPDALPAGATVADRVVAEAYAIPLVVWMFIFLIIGYLGLRYIMED
jgi:hypothetical protein